MSATLTGPPASEPLTLDEVKAHLKIDGAFEDDLLSRYITAARQHIEQRTQEILISQSWAVFFDDWPQNGVMEIPVSPVSEVTGLYTYNSENVAALIDPAHYFVDLAAKPQKLVLRQAMLVLIAHWYENRSPDCTGMPSRNISACLAELLAPYRKVRL